MIRQAIIKLANKQNLTYDEASQVMNEMMSGERGNQNLSPCFGKGGLAERSSAREVSAF